MARPSERVAIVAVHGVADQRPGDTVRELAHLLCHGGSDPPRYVAGEAHALLVPVRPLAATRAAHATQAKDRPGRPSDFFLTQRDVAGGQDLGWALTDHMLARYRPAQRDAVYESTRISLQQLHAQ